MAAIGETLLYSFARGGDAEEVSLQLKTNPDLNVNWANETERNWTFLHLASCNDHAEVVKLLLAHPAIEVNLKDKYGKTPFLLACAFGRVSVVRVLLKDPRVDVILEDGNGFTPLWWAAQNGMKEVIEWLVASGRDLGDVNKKGERSPGINYNALGIARERKRTEVVSLLERFMVNLLCKNTFIGGNRNTYSV